MAKQNKEIFYPGDLVECITDGFEYANILKNKKYIVISVAKNNATNYSTQWLGIKCNYGPGSKVGKGIEPNWGSDCFKLISRSKAVRILFGNYDE
jgi:hypothetical protein